MQLASAHVAAYMRPSWPVPNSRLARQLMQLHSSPSSLVGPVGWPVQLPSSQLAACLWGVILPTRQVHTLPSFWYNYTRIFTYCQKIHNRKLVTTNYLTKVEICGRPAWKDCSGAGPKKGVVFYSPHKASIVSQA